MSRVQYGRVDKAGTGHTVGWAAAWEAERRYSSPSPGGQVETGTRACILPHADRAICSITIRRRKNADRHIPSGCRGRFHRAGLGEPSHGADVIHQKRHPSADTSTEKRHLAGRAECRISLAGGCARSLVVVSDLGGGCFTGSGDCPSTGPATCGRVQRRGATVWP